MKRLASVFLALLVCFAIFSQELSVDSIEPKLSEGADAVFRLRTGHFEITSISGATFSYKEVVTILNKDGAHNALISVGHDKLVKLSNFTASTYDRNGDRVFKSKPSDFKDESATDAGTFYDDNRVRWIDLRQNSYPYTIEYEYKLTYKYLYFIPDWMFVPYVNESVEYTKYQITSPTHLAPKYLSKNIAEPEITFDDGKKTLTWELEDQTGNTYEAYGGALADYSPYVSVTPTIFEFEGYRGDLSTWDGMAQWQNELNRGLGQLPETTISEVKSLTDGGTILEKTQKIYEYVQSKTRYVGIQLGIGGFQPFSASFVDENGYGDCKALSFYTQTLLKQVGVNSYYSWVYGGDNPPKVNEAFPDDLFNHIILCVPIEKDTVWLECTSQTNPFGYLGTFTGGRKALVIKENSGYVVNTTSYDLKDNVKSTYANVAIGEEGNAEVNISSTYKGLKYEEDDLDRYLTFGSDEQKQWLEKVITIPSFVVDDFEFTVSKEIIPRASIKAKLSANKLGSKSGSRFFIQPNLLNRNTFIPVKDDQRERPILRNYAYQEIDSIMFEIPETHEVESFFRPVEVETQFGNYKVEVRKVSGNSFLYKRELQVFEGEFPNTSYQSFVDFYKKIARTDKKRISYKKKT